MPGAGLPRGGLAAARAQQALASAPARRSVQVGLGTIFKVCFGAAAVLALVTFLLSTRVALTLALCAAMVAILLDHAVEALVHRGLRRSWSIVLVMVAASALLAGLGLLLIPPVVEQAVELVAAAPALWDRLQHTRWFLRLDAWLHIQQQLRASGAAAVGAVNPVLAAIGGAITALAGLLGSLFLALSMLVFGRGLVAGALAELEPAGRERALRVAGRIYRSVGGYLAGLLGICTVNAILTTAFLAIIQVPFYLPLGVLSGASSLVPYVGPLVVGVAVTLFAAATGGAWIGLAAAIYFAVYGQLEGNVLAPFVYRRTAHVNQLVTLLAMLFLVELMGTVGAVVAVPVAAAAQVVVAELVAMRRERVRPGGDAPTPG